MAAAEVASRPAGSSQSDQCPAFIESRLTDHVVLERQPHKRPFASWVKRLTNLNKSSSTNKKSKKASKNNPYPESGRTDVDNRYHQSNSTSSTNDFATPPSRRGASRQPSYTSMSEARNADGQAVYNSSRSAAPTVATNPETIHSEAGYSRALTGTTAGGALSSIDGAGANSTFSSPNLSTHSLTTTLTTIQSTNALNPPPMSHTNSNTPSNVMANPSSTTHNPIQFAHQYPVTASAIPQHLQAPSQQQHQPTTYASATAGNLCTDNASILTLASSSKRRRRSMDTDASVRAMAPHSVWGDSRESLPLSILSGNPDHNSITSAPMRPNNLTRDERASVYSNQGVSAPALVSERNSFYAASHKASTFKDSTLR